MRVRIARRLVLTERKRPATVRRPGALALVWRTPRKARGGESRIVTLVERIVERMRFVERIGGETRVMLSLPMRGTIIMERRGEAPRPLPGRDRLVLRERIMREGVAHGPARAAVFAQKGDAPPPALPAPIAPLVPERGTARPVKSAATAVVRPAVSVRAPAVGRIKPLRLILRNRSKVELAAGEETPVFVRPKSRRIAMTATPPLAADRPAIRIVHRPPLAEMVFADPLPVTRKADRAPPPTAAAPEAVPLVWRSPTAARVEDSGQPDLAIAVAPAESVAPDAAPTLGSAPETRMARPPAPAPFRFSREELDRVAHDVMQRIAKKERIDRERRGL